MPQLFHLNCVHIVSPINDSVSGHCLLVQDGDKLVLIDTGIGLLDTQNPEERIGKELVDIVGYRFDESRTALRQIEALGFDPKQVTDCVISHMDNDHIGGLADFPNATVHLSTEEWDAFANGNPRYLQLPLAHSPRIRTYTTSDNRWFGFEARRLELSLDCEIYLIPLFGHTLGHCGVALQVDGQWLFYVADAYYMKVELSGQQHPVQELAQIRADNNEWRLQSLEQIRKLTIEHPEIALYSYHDIDEFRQFLAGDKARFPSGGAFQQ
jgi:glyoxylase-like metal-dependent hydrolase (beta-lactamase superfamily II)